MWKSINSRLVSKIPSALAGGPVSMMDDAIFFLLPENGGKRLNHGDSEWHCFQVKHLV